MSNSEKQPREKSLYAEFQEQDEHPVDFNHGTNDFDTEVTFILKDIQEMLMEKNRKYGDSALNPIRIFSDVANTEQIRVRIDDKLSRMKNQQLDDEEDVISDLIGYLVLLKIAKQRNARS